MSTLPTKQQYWLDHIQRADSFEGSLAGYALDQGMPAQLLYCWRNALQKREMNSLIAINEEVVLRQPMAVSRRRSINRARGREIFLESTTGECDDK